MRRALLLAGVALLLSQPAAAAGERGAALRACMIGAARLHKVQPFLLAVLLRVEGGQLGIRMANTNGTGDLGPFQVNEIWLPRLATHWSVSVEEARVFVRDNLCANAEAAAWILSLVLEDAKGDLWEGVARYHSITPALQQIYLRKVLDAARGLRKEAARG